MDTGKWRQITIKEDGSISNKTLFIKNKLVELITKIRGVIHGSKESYPSPRSGGGVGEREGSATR